MWHVELITWSAWSGLLPRDAAGSQHCTRVMQGLGDEPLGKENSFYEIKCVSRDSHGSVWLCYHPRIAEMLWPGCRKETRSPRSMEMQGAFGTFVMSSQRI